VDDGSTATVTEVVVADGLGWGVDVRFGASIELRKALIAGNHAKGLSIGGAATAILEEIVVRDTLPDAAGDNGWGVQAQAGADIELRRARITGSRDIGMAIVDSTAEIEDVVVRDTRSEEARGLYGWGIAAQRSDVVLLGSLLASNRHFGLTIEQSTARVEQTVVRDTQPAQANGSFGLGIGVSDSEVIALRRSLIETNREQGMILFGASGTIEDVVVRDTLPDADGHFGRGVSVEPGANPSDLVMRRLLLDANRDIGLLVSGSTAMIEELAVLDTQPDAAGYFGRGMTVTSDLEGIPSDVTLLRSRIAGNREIGLIISGSTAEVEDVVVRDTQPQADGTWGQGAYVDAKMAASDVALRRCLIANNYEAGLVVADSTATVEDVVVRDTMVSEAGGLFGDGLVVASESPSRPAHVLVEASLLARSARAGIACFDAGGTVSQSALRANLIGFALDGTCELDIAEDVSLEDNQTDRSAGQSLEPPDPPQAIDPWIGP